MAKRRGPYRSVEFSAPGKSVFNLSYEKKFACDMGQLIPVMCDEVVPGDVFSIANECVIRFQPLVYPIMHEINVYVHYFFVPYRLLWDDSDTDSWEAFITGGPDGDLTPAIPEWDPSGNDLTAGSLWDFLGFPLVDTIGVDPIVFPKRAYYTIYNEYYRDENLIDEVDIDTSYEILNRCWEKDYFTSALPWTQRGTAPALPVTGNAVWDGSNMAVAAGTSTVQVASGAVNNYFYLNGGTTDQVANLSGALSDNVLDAITFDVNDMRLVFQLQRWLEKNARAGARYTEFLRAHFGVSPSDSRLQRPEYIGGTKQPVIVSEVLQTSSTDVTSPQGNMAGHGISVNRGMAAKYRVTEYGLIMGIMSVMPRSVYQDNINRQWLRKTKEDFYFPLFAHLGEQAILNAEVFTTDADADTNLDVFGYQGRYDEMRTKQSMIVGKFRDDFKIAHLSRIFDSVPTLNGTFLSCDMTTPSMKRCYAVTDEPGLFVSFGNMIKAVRPLPYMGTPGYLDH